MFYLCHSLKKYFPCNFFMIIFILYYVVYVKAYQSDIALPFEFFFGFVNVYKDKIWKKNSSFVCLAKAYKVNF